MHMERMLRIIAGVFVLLSVGLGMFVSPKWYYFTAFVGLNLLQSGFTDWCPMMSLLKRLGAESGTGEHGEVQKSDVNSAAGSENAVEHKVIMLDDTNFDSEVLQSEVPVAVDFFASWCGPCRMLSPVVDQAADEMGDSAKVCKLNVDKSRKIAFRYEVMGVPAVLFFKNGQVVDQFTGVRQKQAITDRLRKLM